MLGARLFVLLQRVLPQHSLSGLMHRLARWRNPIWTRMLITVFGKVFHVNMNEALNPDPKAYDCFNAFFTRALAVGARPLCAEPGCIASPADGRISQIGEIHQGRLLQAKGHEYDLIRLLGGDAEAAKPFENGGFATIYLSPRDYHRLHMPVSGRLRQMTYVPGRLFSVNAATTEWVPDLFALNERVIVDFDTECGPLALVLVGAIFVGSIETVWHGEITPWKGPRQVKRWNYPDQPAFAQGAEFARFNMGSTIIVLFGDGAVHWSDGISESQPVRLGEALGHAALPR